MRDYADLDAEIQSNVEKHGLYRSMHEAAAVIREEYEEMWDLIKSKGSMWEIADEAPHVAATAYHFRCELLKAMEAKP